MTDTPLYDAVLADVLRRTRRAEDLLAEVTALHTPGAGGTCAACGSAACPTALVAAGRLTAVAAAERVRLEAAAARRRSALAEALAAGARSAAPSRASDPAVDAPAPRSITLPPAAALAPDATRPVARRAPQPAPRPEGPAPTPAAETPASPAARRPQRPVARRPPVVWPEERDDDESERPAPALPPVAELFARDRRTSSALDALFGPS